MWCRFTVLCAPASGRVRLLTVYTVNCVTVFVTLLVSNQVSSVEKFSEELEGALHIKEQEKVRGKGTCSVNVGDPVPKAKRALTQSDGATFPFPQIIAECEVHCKTILDLIESDVTAVPREYFVDAAQQTKSTIGLMVGESKLGRDDMQMPSCISRMRLVAEPPLTGLSARAQVKDGIVTNLLTGAPASLSKQFQKGDRVVQVDDKVVDEHGTNLTRMLIGSDIPGSLVKVYYQRGNAQRQEVTLKRACTTELADRRRMFQLFTQVPASVPSGCAVLARTLPVHLGFCRAHRPWRGRSKTLRCICRAMKSTMLRRRGRWRLW